MTQQIVPNLIGKRVTVLDKGYVELIDQMPHPATGATCENAIVTAARTSFLGESKGEEADAKLMRYLTRNRHTSPSEQVVFKFLINAPVVTMWQWVRHRTGRYSAQSGRYVDFTEDSFYVPIEWRLQSASDKQGSDGLLNDDASRSLTDLLLSRYEQGYADYCAALNLGVAREQARLFLHGWASYYKWIVQFDAHNLMHFLDLRMDKHAQYEIRVYAEAIYHEFVKILMPETSAMFEARMKNGQ